MKVDQEGGKTEFSLTKTLKQQREYLPVYAVRQKLLHIIRDNPVVIVVGETGSGKTTQLPKICLELGRTRIAHTQPRRIAARSIAERIAAELGVEAHQLELFGF